MKKKMSISLLFVVTLIITSCSGYNYISENDVYYQKPTAINLEENETDVTSFNAFRAKENGKFSEEFQNSNDESFIRNRGFIYGPSIAYGGLGTFINGPIYFHGMGYHDNPFYDPFRNPYYSGFYGHPYYYGSPWGYQNPYYYNGFYSPYWGFNNYGYYDPYYGYGYGPGIYGHGGYYGNGGYYGGGGQNNTASNVFYGKRNTLTSSSSRSSTYPNTLKINQTASDLSNSKEMKANTVIREAGFNDYVRDASWIQKGASEINEVNVSREVTTNREINTNRTEGVGTRTDVNNNTDFDRSGINSGRTYTPNPSIQRENVTVPSRTPNSSERPASNNRNNSISPNRSISNPSRMESTPSRSVAPQNSSNNSFSTPSRTPSNYSGKGVGRR